MIVLGLTGSIAMGKSTVVGMLRSLHIPVHDSDFVVHKLLSRDSATIALIKAALPETPILRSGGIDRRGLGRIIFTNPAKKAILESILHPRVRMSQDRFLRKLQRLGRPLAVLDIPLLFEINAHMRVDQVMVVSAPAFIQRQRALSRPNMTLEKFRAILDAQIPDEEKRARADVVLPSGLGKAYTMQVLKEYLAGLKQSESHDNQ